MTPSIGDVVHLRHRRYLVEQVTKPQEIADENTLVKLVCLDDDSAGRPLSVLWERELGANVERPTANGLGTPSKLDPPRHFAAYLHALKWSSVTATDGRLFQAPFRAGIKIFDHQLVPLQKALQLPRVNLFIADDVGLGKTIEAGLVVQELLLRQRAELILVVCPAAVTLQWRDEMQKRFGLHFELYNREFVARRRQERGFAVKPWATHNRFIVSYQTLRRPEVFEPLLQHLGEGLHHRALLVLDEAHSAAPASASRYAIDTETTTNVRQLTERFEHRLFLSATPHNGHSNSFSALLEMLDPQRFARGTRPRESQLEAVMVRRLKADLKNLGAAEDIPTRVVHTVRLDRKGADWVATWLDATGTTVDTMTCKSATPPVELELAKLLAEYTELRRPKHGAGRLVFENLQKRLLSSVEAFHRTLSVHAAASGLGVIAEAERVNLDEGGETYGRTDVEIEDQLDDESRQETIALMPPEMRAMNLLDSMLKMSGQYRRAADGKLLALVEWIRKHQCSLQAGATWTDTRVIIFTEYGDTLRYLKEQLAARFEPTDEGESRLLTFTGGIGDARREEVQRAFNSPPDEHPVRVLLATDAAREGINLQGHCADLFHFDVPWNPSRLEQRNGRIDRTMQPSPEVRCAYFVYADREEDKVLDTLARKVEVIQHELGSLSSVVLGRMHDAMSGGIGPDTLEALNRAEEATHLAEVKRELESQRNRERLGAELKSVRAARESSTKVLEFERALLRDALDVGFEMLGSGRMTRDGETWRLPELPEAWSRTLDSLRPPRERDEAPWDWRKRPLLPVVFEAPERMNSALCQLHLSHPVVQRVMQRFLAQGFSATDLSRVTVVRSKRDAVARLIVFGRLSLFGEGATRLHDKVISVAAKWVDGGGKDHLKPFAEKADTAAVEQLEATLAEAPELSAISEATQRKLRTSAPKDFAELWPAVEAEAEKQKKDAVSKLEARGQREKDDLSGILEGQRVAISEALGEHQRELDFGTDDTQTSREQKDQWRRDKVHLEKRLTALEKEMKEQPARLAERYRVVLARVVPVGMVYLWPATR